MTVAVRKSRMKETLPMRVGVLDRTGVLLPADGFCQKRLREKGLKVGDMVTVQVRRMREYWYHKMVHLFGELVAQSIDDFRGMTAHDVLKRLQAEAQIGCEAVSIRVMSTGEMAVMYYPRSLAYDEMDQDEFENVFTGFCQHVVEHYWPTLDLENIQALVEIMGEQVS